MTEIPRSGVVQRNFKNTLYEHQSTYNPNMPLRISMNLLPVRDGRNNPRKVKLKSAVSFLYRVA